MTTRTVIATLELAKRTVYSGTSEAASMPASYLSHPQPKRRWRAPSLSQIEVYLDMTAGLAAYQQTGILTYRYLFPLYGSATRAATHEMWIGPTRTSVGSTATASWYSGVQSYWRSLDNDLARFPRRHSVIDVGSQRTEPWIRYKITDPANPDGFHDLGLLVPTPGYEPTLAPMGSGPGAGVEEEVRETRSVGSARRRLHRARERVRSYTFQAVGPTAPQEAEDQLLALQETAGVSDPVIIVDDVTATTRFMNRIVYGTLEGLQKFVLPDIYQKAQVELDVKEML